MHIYKLHALRTNMVIICWISTRSEMTEEKQEVENYRCIFSVISSVRNINYIWFQSKIYLQVISPFQNLTWERDDACRTETCMWRLMRSTSGLGPVTNPSLIPELNTFENESNRKTRPSVSRDKKLGARFSANLKIKIKYLKETIWRVGIQS